MQEQTLLLRKSPSAENPTFPENSALSQILSEEYKQDPYLILESSLPQFPYSETDSTSVAKYYCKQFNSWIPFSEAFIFDVKPKDRKREKKERVLKRKILAGFLKIGIKISTPSQRKIFIKYSLNILRGTGKTLKEMAGELNIPESTLHQQLFGRNRNGERIGGLFPKIHKVCGINDYLPDGQYMMFRIPELEKILEYIENAKAILTERR